MAPEKIAFSSPSLSRVRHFRAPSTMDIICMMWKYEILVRKEWDQWQTRSQCHHNNQKLKNCLGNKELGVWPPEPIQGCKRARPSVQNLHVWHRWHCWVKTAGPTSSSAVAKRAGDLDTSGTIRTENSQTSPSSKVQWHSKLAFGRPTLPLQHCESAAGPTRSKRIIVTFKKKISRSTGFWEVTIHRHYGLVPRCLAAFAKHNSRETIQLAWYGGERGLIW